MSKPVPIDDMLKHCPSIYKLAVIAARRAKELAAGSPKLVDIDTKKITTIALEEIRQGKVFYKLDGDERAGPATKPKRRAAKKEEKKRKS